MNGLLAVAAAFLERMTNPQYGPDVNEEYSFRLHEALAEDPEFARSFATLDLAPDDVESLPACAWPWYLQWREGHGTPPSAGFLDALFDYTDDPAVRLSVVDSAVFQDYPGAPPAGRSPDDDASPPEAGDPDVPTRALRPVQERRTAAGSDREPFRPLHSPWVSGRTTRLAGLSDPARSRADASEMASYLLQLGDPVSLESLRELIGRPWAGRESLILAVRQHIREANLDPEAAAALGRELGLPPGGQA
jgi:hypothetical protein